VALDDTLVMILAGGQGSRFWPLSRSALPKQFLSLGDSGESLIQATVRRIEPLVGADNVCVVANGNLEPLIRKHVPRAKILQEPMPRNTAACIGLAAVYALAESPGTDPILIILPADHAIKDEKRLCAALEEAAARAREDRVLVTIGIPPSRPHTGYGYIKKGRAIGGRSFAVERFFEKPSIERAQKYLEQGGYCWNSGMFAWRASVILDSFKSFLPQMAEGLSEIQSLLVQKGAGSGRAGRITEIFSSFESISIDFGVLEHAKNCVVIDAQEFGWNDVGSWDQWAESFERDSDGNLIKGEAVVIDSQGCVIRSADRVVAAVGLKDVIVIDSGDALLVVSHEHVQDVRKVVEELKRRGRTDLV
jgi:mannose-1-phosphate guanylyltransferase